MFDFQFSTQDTILRLHSKVHCHSKWNPFCYTDKVLNSNIHLCVLSTLQSLEFGSSAVATGLSLSSMSSAARQQFPQNCSYCDDSPCFKLRESGRIVFPEAVRMIFISEAVEVTHSWPISRKKIRHRIFFKFLLEEITLSDFWPPQKCLFLSQAQHQLLLDPKRQFVLCY